MASPTDNSLGQSFSCTSQNNDSISDMHFQPTHSIFPTAFPSFFTNLSSKSSTSSSPISLSNTLNVNSPAYTSSSSISAMNSTNMNERIIAYTHETESSDADTMLIEDPRTLQLALELSMATFNRNAPMHVQKFEKSQTNLENIACNIQQQLTNLQQKGNQTFQPVDISNIGSSPMPNKSSSDNLKTMLTIPGIDDRLKKSQNMTECVPVPSSEHVAEIVGRQGCKIKALRAKTNTYIKTPVRGEEPVFVVTGRKEDVNKAKREILSAAEHFSVIRTTRKPPLPCLNDLQATVGLTEDFGDSVNFAGSSSIGPSILPGQVTLEVRVPYRVVGLVVGPKGATIKHIQQKTQTYIVTPSREKEPTFEITGFPENVQEARKQIESHIALRTGSSHLSNISSSNEIAKDAVVAINNSSSVQTVNSFSDILKTEVSKEFLASIYKNGLCTALDIIDTNYKTDSSINSECGLNIPCQTLCDNLSKTSSTFTRKLQASKECNEDNDFLNSDAYTFSNIAQSLNSIVRPSQTNAENFSGNAVMTASVNSTNTLNGQGQIGVNAKCISRSCSSASSTSSRSAHNSGGSNCSRIELNCIWKNLANSMDIDEGLGDSPCTWKTSTLPSNTNFSPPTSDSPTSSLLAEGGFPRQLQSNEEGVSMQIISKIIISNQCNENDKTNNLVSQRDEKRIHKFRQMLFDDQSMQICNANLRLNHNQCMLCSNKVTASFMSCGHSLLCIKCANQIYSMDEVLCPICGQGVDKLKKIPA